MSDPRLVEYLRKGIESGHSLEQMEKALVKEGWSRGDVDKAVDKLVEQRDTQEIMGGRMSHLPEELQPEGAGIHETQLPEASTEQGVAQQAGQPPAQKPGEKPSESEAVQSKTMGVVSKFKAVIAHPGKFFQAVKAEKGYEAPVKYYLFLMLIEIIVINATLVAAIFLGLGTDAIMGDAINILELGLGIVTQFIFVNIFILLGIVGVFIMSWIIGVFIRMFGGKGTTLDTFKGLVYAATPATIMIIITIPISVFMGISILEPALSSAAGTIPIELLSTMNLYYMIILIIGGVFSIWGLYLSLKGQSIFHEISMGKVFFAMIVAGIVIGIIVSLIQFGLMSILLLSFFAPI